MWERVWGEDLHPDNWKRYEANSKVLADRKFIAACEKVGIPTTRRQASKFRRKKGLAFKGV